jgi:sortase A
MKNRAKNQIVWLGGGLLLVFLAGVFLLLPHSAEAPEPDYSQLNLGRNDFILPIEQVALPLAAPSPTTKTPPTSSPLTSRVTPVPTSTAVAMPTLPPNRVAGRGLFPVRLEIPSVKIDGSIVESYLDQNEAIYVPLLEAGHYIGSARPGEAGNMVIVGHVRRGLIFNRLSGVKLNDLIKVYDEAGIQHTYRVAQIELVPVAGASSEQIQTGLLYTSPTSDERLTLVTCYPETSYANRLVVIGVPARAV